MRLELSDNFPKTVPVSTDLLLDRILASNHSPSNLVTTASYILEPVVAYANDEKDGFYCQFYLDYHLLRPIFDTMNKGRLEECMMYIQHRLNEIDHE